jgi:hypothetical protein
MQSIAVNGSSLSQACEVHVGSRLRGSHAYVSGELDDYKLGRSTYTMIRIGLNLPSADKPHRCRFKSGKYMLWRRAIGVNGTHS